jgi:hypothetical protein
MEQAAALVSGFGAEDKLRSASVRSPGNQFLDPLGSFFHQNLNRRGIAQAVAGIECVLQMERNFVFVAQYGAQSVLRRRAMRLGYLFFREDEHTSGSRQFNRSS